MHKLRQCTLCLHFIQINRRHRKIAKKNCFDIKQTYETKLGAEGVKWKYGMCSMVWMATRVRNASIICYETEMLVWYEVLWPYPMYQLHYETEGTNGHWSSRLQGIIVHAYSITLKNRIGYIKYRIKNAKILFLAPWTHITFEYFFPYPTFFLLEENEKRILCSDAFRSTTIFFPPYFVLHIFLSLPLACVFHTIRLALAFFFA